MDLRRSGVLLSVGAGCGFDASCVHQVESRKETEKGCGKDSIS